MLVQNNPLENTLTFPNNVRSGALGFSVFPFWPFFWSVFAPKNLGFFVLVSVLVCGFSFFSIWFSVFAQNTSGFTDLVSLLSAMAC